LPLSRRPLLPGSTLSIVTLAVWKAPLQTNGLRWLCHHAAATLLDPSYLRAGSRRRDATCFAETQRAWPVAQR
jgi:hypothetical protein